MREQTVQIPAAGALLAGTLTQPDDHGRHPSALLINGSGPIDRDSAMPGTAVGLGRTLATALADNGCVLLRYDKRGVGASGGDYLNTGFHDECNDAAAVLAALRAHPAVDPERVFVVGHSTGAVVAANLTRATAPPAGYVLLAGAAQSGERVMAWQSDRIAATLPRPLRPLGPLLIRRQARERNRVRMSTADRHDRMPRSRLTDRCYANTWPTTQVRTSPASTDRCWRSPAAKTSRSTRPTWPVSAAS